MRDDVVRPGQTLFLPERLSFGQYARVDGAETGGAGGTVFLTNRDTLQATGKLVIGGGNGQASGVAAGAGGTVNATGALVNLGQILVEGGAADALDAPDTKGGGGGTLEVSGVFTNESTVTLESGMPRYFAGGAYAGGGGVLLNTGTATNYGLIDITDANYIRIAPGGRSASSQSNGSAGALTNSGTFANAGMVVLYTGLGDGSTELTNDGQFTNTGTIEVGGGNYAAGTIVNDGSFSNLGAIDIGGGYGLFTLYAESTPAELVSHGYFYNKGIITLQGGGGDSGFGGGLGGLLYVGGGVFVNRGTVMVNNGTYGQYGPGFGADLYVAPLGSLTNYGTIVVSGGASPINERASLQVGDETGGLGGGVLKDFGLIELKAGQGYGAPALDISRFSYLDMHGGTILGDGDFGQVVPLNNAGYIAGTGTISVTTLENNGTIGGEFSNLLIQGNIDGHGEIKAAPGGELTVDGVIGSGQRIFLYYGSLTTPIENAPDYIRSGAGMSLDIVTFTGAGSATLNSADTKLTVQLGAFETLSLSAMGFLTVDARAGNDTVVAEAAGQTLLGGGNDTLIGAAADGDSFKGTAALLNGDVIGNFAGSDVIDITDLASGPGLVLDYTQAGNEGTLSVSEGGVSTNIVLLGTFTQSEFTTSSNNAGGVLIHP